MIRTPEPHLLPPELSWQPLRCCLCHRITPEALELPFGCVCRTCLTDDTRSMDELSAILCAPIVAEEPSFPEGGTP